VSEWSFQGKLITGILMICLLAILTSAASLFTSRILISNTARVASGENRELADARALQLAGVRYIADARARLLTSASTHTLTSLDDAEKLRERVTRLQSTMTDPQGRALLGDVIVAQTAHQSAFDSALGVARAGGGAWAALHPEPVLERAAEYDHALAAFVGYVERIGSDRVAPARAAANRTESVLTLILLATILLLVLLCVLMITVLGRSYRRQTVARVSAEHGQTEAKASLSEAEAASHMKDEFLATVSHELRNPLAPILTWTQLLRSGTLDQEKSRRALEVIERNVLSQAQLIDDLVDVSRVASGKFRLDVRPIDLVPVIRAAADSQVPASDAKQIRLQLVLDERAGLISGDSERIQQVMWNLISNAIKFTPKGGRVQVVLQRAESHVEIVVSDSGIGIDPGFLPHVFEPFRQATGGSMRRHGGLGLGLSIVRHIVELHGGEIEVISAGSDQGSRFTVKFPLLATARESGEPVRRHPIARDAPSDVRLARLDGIKVLVVEDEPTAIEALLALFGSCGAEARGAGSAPEALAILDAWPPDVVVSDIAMPGEDGYSLIRKIRLRSPAQGGAVPAVALTAYGKIEDRVTILGAGFQMYLAKPADPNELVAVVKSLAKRRGTDVTLSAN
jgi:signal transduction histidine kinase/ActR/RegA family two-component response regulator